MTTELAKYKQLKQMVASDEIQQRFNEVLGEKAPAFLASLLSVTYADNRLRECDPNTVVTSAMKAAVLDLPVDKNIGFAWIIPYKNSAEFQMGYKGYIQLALRTGQYQAINAFEIYEGEQLIEDRVSGKIKIEGERAGDKVTHYASYFQLNNGFEHAEVMTVEEIDNHAAKFSKSYQRKDSAWNTSYSTMAKKTVLKRNISRYGPLSIDVKKAFEADEDNGIEVDDRFNTPELDDIVEGEVEIITDNGGDPDRPMDSADHKAYYDLALNHVEFTEAGQILNECEGDAIEAYDLVLAKID